MARLLVRLLAALGLLLLVVTFTPLVPWYARALSGIWDEPKGEILIVLGGGAIDDTTLATGSYWRAVYGERTWRHGGFRQMLISGKNVAPLMRSFLVCQGVPGGAIQTEGNSVSTRENALEAARRLASTPGRKVLVTSDYHMFRARRAFAKAGLAVRACPYPDVVKSSNSLAARWTGFVTLAQETAKIVYYKARGWI
ncbi:MAG TPA: YdcF family protein [Bryobacteraceae bacterium]|nr:YdcF family protein [Bryobacteraceae bacterium]